MLYSDKLAIARCLYELRYDMDCIGLENEFNIENIMLMSDVELVNALMEILKEL